MLKRFHSYLGLIQTARSGFPQEKTTKGSVASVYTNCATALGVQSTLFLFLSLGLPPTLIAQSATGQPAQAATPNASPNAADTQSTQDPLRRPLSDKEKFKQQKELRNELKGPYKKWVDEDVRWIITDQELKAFNSWSVMIQRTSSSTHFL